MPQSPRELTEENQRPFEPLDEQQLERTSVDGEHLQPPTDTPPGKQVSGAPPASPNPTGA